MSFEICKNEPGETSVIRWRGDLNFPNNAAFEAFLRTEMAQGALQSLQRGPEVRLSVIIAGNLSCEDTLFDGLIDGVGYVSLGVARNLRCRGYFVDELSQLMVNGDLEASVVFVDGSDGAFVQCKGRGAIELFIRDQPDAHSLILDELALELTSYDERLSSSFQGLSSGSLFRALVEAKQSGSKILSS